ncbi:HU family DNA-binding protein (plasmid) [Trichlorobacter lovleyi]|uniref:HU family DNA-binding protein n=1 Tax=Trichlorobacter lovleyi TaxID=313985 RepID=UPI00223FD841|nr:HU family DNA-binding protein [Trichlorobacter lovleyi]QOX80932.1 HU family DNA-binding protein [Trichlorobacter lovleyi]
MNKNELIGAVSEKSGVKKAEVEKVLNGFVECVEKALASKDKIALVGFGTFEVSERAARTGRNPQTGKEIKIAASVVPKFKPGKSLKDAVSGLVKK